MKRIITILAAMALVCAFALPAPAADWSFYGSARMSTFRTSLDPGGEGGDTVDNTTWALQGNSRLGAKVKAGDVFGSFEYGTGVNVRKLYGEWDFGAGKLLVGQTYTPINFFPSNQVFDGDTDLLPFGGVYRGRRPMLQLKFGTFKLAFIQPNAADDVGTGSRVDVGLPQVELAYKFKTDMFYVDVFGGWQSYELAPAGDSTIDTSVDSWIAGLNGGVNVGPVGIKASYFAGMNLGPYGMWVTGNADPTFTAAGDTEDNDSWGALAVATFKATDMLSFEVGWATLEHEVSDSDNADDTSSYYVNAVITFAPGVFVVPEIGMVDFGDNMAGLEEGDNFYWGAKWQINF